MEDIRTFFVAIVAMLPTALVVTAGSPCDKTHVFSFTSFILGIVAFYLFFAYVIYKTINYFFTVSKK